MSKQKSGPVDVMIGQRLKDRRLELGLSQQRLAELVGVTFQQIQKYERGANRVSSSKLHELARFMHTPISYFFSEGASYTFPDEVMSELAEGQTGYEALSDIEKTQLRELMYCFNNIKDPVLRESILNLAKRLGKY